jgi:hypothetical protein
MSIPTKVREYSGIAAVLALFLGLSLCTDVYAGKTKTAKAPAAPGDKTMVNAVDVAAKQVTILIQSSSQKLVYTVDDFTKITVDGNAAQLSGVHSGQEVYSYVERDSQALDSLDVGAVRAEPKTDQ